jgi:TonB family protein
VSLELSEMIFSKRDRANGMLHSCCLPASRRIAGLAACAMLLACGGFCAERRGLGEAFLVEPVRPGEPATPHAAADRSGTINTRENQTLRLSTDLGSVKIVPLEQGAAPVVRYAVHIETDAKGSFAQNLLDHYVLLAKATSRGAEINGSLPAQSSRSSAGAQFWVEYVVYVPASYSVSVNTGAGDIQTQDIGGTASLVTWGGNIRAGRIGFLGPHTLPAAQPVARLETEGGHIQVLDVAGDTTAFTAGGHVNAGNIAGDAILRSGGGHIHAGQINGRAQLETDGGNITVGKAGSFVAVRTGGGQIDFGEVRGSVHAQTGGGGIRVMYVSGPMEVESNGGSICLTRVAGAVRAVTAGGTITAWINPDSPSSAGTVRLPGASQLASGVGDIVVFLPRNLAATIDATVETGGEHRIEADPGLQFDTQTVPNSGAGPVHATATLNGGGEVLKLRTTAGKIRLQFLDSQVALRESLINEQKARLAQHLNEASLEQVNIKNSGSFPSASDFPDHPESGNNADWVDSMLDRLEVAILGGIREDAEEFKKRLTYSPAPCYPELARRAGLQGMVRLQVRVSKEGAVEVQKLLQGDPALADAAIAAVKQWRAKPEWISGRKVEVISLLSFNFQLQ